MQQEAAQELVDIEGEPLVGIAVCVVAIAEADLLAVEREDPGVADGDAVGVVGEISEDLLRSTERRLAVDDPVRGGGPCQEQVESDRVGKDSFGERERALTACLAEKAGQQTSEAAREDLDGKEERGLGNRAPLLAMNRKAAARYDAMDVRMQSERLSPGVKHAQATGLDLQAAVGNVNEGSTGGSEQQVGVRLGRMDVGMTEQDLHDARARTLLDQMSGIAMAQRSGGDLLRPPGLRHQTLQVSLHSRWIGRTRWIGLMREQQIAQVLATPVLAQHLQQKWRERDVTILLAFPLPNANDHALGIDVGGSQRQRLAQAKTGGIDRRQQDAVARVIDRAEQFDRLFDR